MPVGTDGAHSNRYPAAMSRILLDHMIWDIGQAYDALFANLKDLRDDDWDWIPAGGARSITGIVGHVASNKTMFGNHAFGDASMTWEDPRVNDGAAPDSALSVFTPDRLVDWIRRTDLELRRSVDSLANDDELVKRRPVLWGGTRSTRWILSHLIQHDGFHAGEINHIRSLHQQNDRWSWEQAE